MSYVPCVLIAVLTGWGMSVRFRKVPAERATKVLHVLFVLFLLLVHYDPFMWSARALVIVGREGLPALRRAFSIDEGILPPEVSLAVWVLCLVATDGVMWLTFIVAAGRASGRKCLAVLLPFIYVLDSYLAYLQVVPVSDTARRQGAVTFMYTQALYAVLFGWVYVSMFCFYRSGKTDALFTTVPSKG